MSEQIRISRQELFSTKVNRALEKERRLRGKPVPDAPPVSPLRAFFMSSLFYLPLAGVLAGLLAWLIIEPYFADMPIVAGEVMLVNTDPMFAYEGNAISLTVGEDEVIVFPDNTLLEDGLDGQPAFAAVRDIQAGMFVEVAADEFEDGPGRFAMAIRPATEEQAARAPEEGSLAAQLLFLPLTAVLIALSLLVAEGVSSRNWLRMLTRAAIGTLLTALFCALATIPAGLVMTGAQGIAVGMEDGFFTAKTMGGPGFVIHTAGRSAAWAIFGAALGLGMNLVRTTKAQLRNSVVGGALGGALGGAFFDPISRFFSSGSFFAGAETERLTGLLMIGLCVGVFVALVDQLAREAWIKVRTGPLAGKAFVLYRSPTTVGSAPEADIYLFKDAEISPRHAAIHRVGNRFEIEDTGSRMGTHVNRERIRRRRLDSGDQVVIGATVLEFEERAKQNRR